MITNSKAKDKWHVFIVLISSILVSAGITIWSQLKTEKSHFQYNTFHCVNGWGYEILVNNKLFIRQESIPGKKGTQGFSTEKQASNTAELIINKMKSGEVPALTTFEVSQVTTLKDQK
jgi:hypothetical protein